MSWALRLLLVFIAALGGSAPPPVERAPSVVVSGAAPPAFQAVAPRPTRSAVVRAARPVVRAVVLRPRLATSFARYLWHRALLW